MHFHKVFVRIAHVPSQGVLKLDAGFGIGAAPRF
jgi:hypothetical protein